MLYTPQTKRAMILCFKAHQYQKDKSGLPYVFHPYHLAEQLETEDEICVALLHDVVEDGMFSLEELQKEGFSQNILSAISLLTHKQETPYMEYIGTLKENALARRVKIEDLKHNQDLTRLNQITEKDKKRAQKYEAAIKMLETC